MQVDLDVHKHRVHHNCRFDTARFEEGKRRSRCRTLRMSHLTLLRRNAWIAASSSIISILRIVGCRHYLSNGRRVGYYGIGKAAVCHLEIYPRDDR